ncbi:hypothetical protein [Streptomyces sp. CB02009]|uniref:hypothetical protein n=1 Tax=Streptomyces sp. CB02009 TaxID=1703938 RepID=UPI00403E7A7A
MQARQPDPSHDLVDAEIPQDPDYGPDRCGGDALPGIDPQRVFHAESDEPEGGESSRARFSGQPGADREKDDEREQNDAAEGETQDVQGRWFDDLSPGSSDTESTQFL